VTNVSNRMSVYLPAFSCLMFNTDGYSQVEFTWL